MDAQSQAFPPRRSRPPLDPATIRALALHYVGRYATTQARLARYLGRKLRERGWVETSPAPDVQAIVSDFVRLGYVDDDAFATARVNSLLRRGYGVHRLNTALRHAGISPEMAGAATQIDAEAAREAAMNFARRKHLGPFGPPLDDPKARARAFAAFGRAGHSYETTRIILELDAEDCGEFEF